MPIVKNKFSKRSLENLKMVHPDLHWIFHSVLKYQDCTIIEGLRGKTRQNELYEGGSSKLQWPNSKHNLQLGQQYVKAVDVAPCFKGKIMWKDQGAFYMFVGRVKQITDILLAENRITHRIRCGADWDKDGLTDDQVFDDLPHFELVPVL